MVNFELLKEAYAIIDGIPKRRFDLDRLAVPKRPGKHSDEQPLRAECGSVACAMGWLAMHPLFRAMGLWVSRRGVLYLNSVEVDYDYAAARVFNLDRRDAANLFCQATVFEEEEFGDHKSIWQTRVRLFLEQHHQLYWQL
jgi:hypothetical protein